MGRNYSGNSGAESLYRSAQGAAKRSIRSKTGPAQIEVVKKFSGAARLFEQEGNLYGAREALENAQKFVGDRGGGSAYSKMRTTIDRRLDELNAKMPAKQRGMFSRYSFVFASVAIATFVVALFFISFDLTGHVVLGQPRTNLSFLAAGLFVFGLIFVFLYFKSKK